jgi:ketosteroid isomerase-like protein
MGTASSDIDLIRELFRRFEAGEFERLFELVDPELEIRNALTGRSVKGMAEVRRAATSRIARGRAWRTSDLKLEPVAGGILVTGRVESESALGSPIGLPFSWIISVANGKIRRAETFVNERHARGAIESDAAGGD